jgi:CHAT domain-containing protein
LVMLDACNSAELTIDPYRSVASALVRAQIPAVIAMQFTVPQEATRAFAGEFYRALAEGLPIDACVTEGRKAVMNETGLRNPDWGIPVVYTRAPDGKLFDLPRTPASAASATPAATTGTNVSIGSGNQLNDSSINISNVGNTKLTQEAERAEQIAALQELIKANRRRLSQRQLQAAKYGIGADPSILIEIEDLTKEIPKLERDLKALGG